MSLVESKTIEGSLAGVYTKDSDALIRSVSYDESDAIFKIGALSCTKEYYFWPSMYVDDRQRHCIFMYGSSGIGKSTWADSYMAKFLDNKDYRCLVIKPDEDEGKYTGKNTKCMTPFELRDLVKSEDKQDENILDLFTNPRGRCLVIFDDVLSSSDKDIEKFMQKTIDLVSERGRKFRIDMIVITHMGSNHKQTRVLHNECNIVWFSPKDLTHNSIYTLEKKFGLDKKVISKLKSSPDTYGRWAIISQDYPKYLLTPKKIALISGEYL